MTNKTSSIKSISPHRVFALLVRALDERMKILEQTRGYPRGAVDAMRELGVSDEELKAFGLNPAFGSDGPHYIPQSPERVSQLGNKQISVDSSPNDCIPATKDQALACIRFSMGKANVLIGESFEVWERELVEDLFVEIEQAGTEQQISAPVIIINSREKSSGYPVGIYSTSYGKYLYFESIEREVIRLCASKKIPYIMHNKQIVEELRAKYPVGTRIELIKMEDPYRTMPQGLRGTVRGVDDAASILVHWDNGSSLSLVYGEDQCKILSPEKGKVMYDIYFRPEQPAVIALEFDDIPLAAMREDAQERLDGMERDEVISRLCAAVEVGALEICGIERIG